MEHIGTIRTSALGAAMAASEAPKGPAATAFQRALAGSRIAEPWEVQLANGVRVPCVLTIVGNEGLLLVESQVRKRMRELDIPEDVTTQGNFQLLRARYVLAMAVREKDEKLGANAPLLGTVEEWGDVTVESIQHTFNRYSELCEEHDPMRDGATVSEEEALELRAAVEKKNRQLLQFFGLQKVIAWLLSSAFPPALSPIPTSDPGDSLPAS